MQCHSLSASIPYRPLNFDGIFLVYYHEFDDIVTAIGEVGISGFTAYVLRSERYSRRPYHMSARK
jgi:hypothetical protein